jgi:hypothetical protein
MATSITSVLSTPASLTSTYNATNSSFTASFSVSGLIDSNFPANVLSGAGSVFNATLAYTVTGTPGTTTNYLNNDATSILLTLGSIYGTQSFYGFVKQPGSVYSSVNRTAEFVIGFTGSDFYNTSIALSSNATTVVLNTNQTSYIDIPQSIIPFDNDALNNVSYIHTVGDNVRRWNLFG